MRELFLRKCKEIELDSSCQTTSVSVIDQARVLYLEDAQCEKFVFSSVWASFSALVLGL